MSETAAPAPNCLEIIDPFVQELAAHPELPEVQIMGGVGSVALKHPRTELLVDEKLIITPVDFLTDTSSDEGQATQAGLTVHRPNGTLRDLDGIIHNDH
ncbi:MAG TPA: hypothetical protein VHA37_09755 [Candidatus Saccharimonadales bacterium]|nr:hypothetical protein [Candidatus Saccharimonadales bacterium]